MLNALTPEQLEHLYRTYSKITAGRPLTEKEKQDYDNALLYALEYRAYLTKQQVLRLIQIIREHEQAYAITALSEAHKKLEAERQEFDQNYQRAKEQALANPNNIPPVNIITFDVAKFDLAFPRLTSLDTTQKEQLVRYEQTKDITQFQALVESCDESQLAAVNEFIHVKRQNELISNLPKEEVTVGCMTLNKNNLQPTLTPPTAGEVLEVLEKIPEEAKTKEEDAQAGYERKQAFAKVYAYNINTLTMINMLRQCCEADNITSPSATQSMAFVKWINAGSKNIPTSERNLSNEEQLAIQIKSFRQHFQKDNHLSKQQNQNQRDVGKLKPIPKGG